MDTNDFHRLDDLVSERLLSAGLAILDAIPDLILVLILILITRYVLKITRVFVDAIRDGNLAINRFLPEWADSRYRIVRLVRCAGAGERSDSEALAKEG